MKLLNNFKKHKNKEVIYVALFITIPLILLIGLAFLTKYQGDKVAEIQISPEPVKVEIKPKINVQIAGKAAYVQRINTGEVLMKKNEKEALPLASITKAMTSLFAYENIKPETIIPITDYDLAQFGEYNLFLGETFKKEKMIDFTMVSSSNDTASALISYISKNQNQTREKMISQMNEYGKKDRPNKHNI